jgi:hypothetical protein
MHTFKDSMWWVEEEIFWVCMATKQGLGYICVQPTTARSMFRPRSAVLISRLVREKYCSGWKNQLKKTDYKPDEQGLRLQEYQLLLVRDGSRNMCSFKRCRVGPSVVNDWGESDGWPPRVGCTGDGFQNCWWVGRHLSIRNAVGAKACSAYI